MTNAGSSEVTEASEPSASRVEHLRLSLEQQLGPAKLVAAHRSALLTVTTHCNNNLLWAVAAVLVQQSSPCCCASG